MFTMNEMNMRERDAIIIAWLVIALLFSRLNPVLFALLLIPTGIVFVGKWLVEKWVAKQYNYATHFILYKEGILMSILITFLTLGHFIWLSIGGLNILGRRGWGFGNSIKEEGIIALSGILWTLGLGYLGLLMGPPVCGTFWGMISRLGFFIALWSALPFCAFEGRKVFEWNKVVWAIVMLAASVGLFVLY